MLFLYLFPVKPFYLSTPLRPSWNYQHMRMGYIISTAFGPNDVTHFVLAPELISSLIWTTEAYVPATIVNVPMSTKMTLTTVRIHQLRVLWFRHVTCRYMRASVILGRQLVEIGRAHV